jgi:ribosomal protein L11 methyltransferase
MWKEIIISVNEQHAEEVSDALMDAGALSVSVEDEWADTEAEKPLYGEPGLEPTTNAWEQSRLVVLVDADVNTDDLLAEAYGELNQAVPAYTQRDVPAQDWVRLTQSQFEPIEITPHLWIVPTWHETDETDVQRINLRLDPGLAFGTGSHPTTRLCLKWLAQHLPTAQDASVLDYGCGSGILAITAKKLGAGAVLGTDIDAQAVQSSVDNALMNQTDAQFVLPDAMPQDGKYQIVVANILSNPLKLLAPALVNYVQSGGFLVLSGILERQTDEIIEAYAPYMKMTLWRAEDGWICLVGQAD